MASSREACADQRETNVGFTLRFWIVLVPQRTCAARKGLGPLLLLAKTGKCARGTTLGGRFQILWREAGSSQRHHQMHSWRILLKEWNLLNQMQVLIEHLLATFQMDEIVHALKDYIVGINCCRKFFFCLSNQNLTIQVGTAVIRNHRFSTHCCNSVPQFALWRIIWNFLCPIHTPCSSSPMLLCRWNSANSHSERHFWTFRSLLHVVGILWRSFVSYLA